MTSDPNQEANESDSEPNQAASDAGENSEEKSLRDIVTPDSAASLSDSDAGGDRGSPGLDRDETATDKVTAPESEVKRALIVPDVSTASKSDGDRSPGLDRDLTESE